jgi:hypothetical protein
MLMDRKMVSTGGYGQKSRIREIPHFRIFRKGEVRNSNEIT